MAECLTEETVAQLEPPAKGHRIVFDCNAQSPAGFGVRITAKGVRSYVLRYRWAGCVPWEPIQPRTRSYTLPDGPKGGGCVDRM